MSERTPANPQSLNKLSDKKLHIQNICVSIDSRGTNGSMPEWLMGADCKSAGYAYAGSNPARPTTILFKILCSE